MRVREREREKISYSNICCVMFGEKIKKKNRSGLILVNELKMAKRDYFFWTSGILIF